MQKLHKQASDIEDELINIWCEILKISTIGIHDNFYSTGGNSLNALLITLRVRTIFGINLSLDDFLNRPTIHEIAKKIRKGESTESNKIKTIERTEFLSPSAAQRRLWFVDQWDPNNPVYNIPLAVRIKGDLDRDIIKMSFQRIIERHEILRTNFINRDGSPFVIVHKSFSSKIETLDFTRKSSEEVQNYLDEESRVPFDLAKDPLCRIKVLEISHDEHIIVFTMHHIVSDGWSIEILMSELIDIYSYFLGNKTSLPPEIDIQYLDYAAWHNEYLNSEIIEKQFQYWENRLAKLPNNDLIKLDHKRPEIQNSKGTCEFFTIDQNDYQSLVEICRQENASSFMVLLTLFYLTIYKTSNVSDITLGTPIANRMQEQTENIIGFFANMVALRIDTKQSSSFASLLENVKTEVHNAQKYQEVSFDLLIDKLGIKRELNKSPIFQVLFVYQTLDTSQFNTINLEIEPIIINNKTSKFDLTFTIYESNGKLLCSFEYNTDIYSQKTILKLKESYTTLCKQIINDPKTNFNDLLAIEDDSASEINEFNDELLKFQKSLEN
jgi:acyl carrier protein